jgi:predicted unusual protein kinase regulating ubiquinone biosynthesis (AarF/ABC1/UbiB family)
MLRPAALGARGAAGVAGTWARGLFRDADAREQAQVDRLVRTAEQAAALMGEMKGAVMKLGQMLSFADISALPPEVQTVLASLQADAPPMAWDLVEEVVTGELGAHPADLFDRFSEIPIAAASIGQVHAATLHDGTDVVVKVQYPGVAEAIDADLRNTALLSTFATMAKAVAGPLMPRTDMRAMADELRDRVLEELDYVREAANQQRFADLWRGHPTIRVPEVVHPLSSRRVLTQHYHDGMRWAAAVDAPNELRDRWAEAIYRFVFTSLYHHHVFNADPHPGNYLFHEDGSVTFLDFGCVRVFDQAHVDALRSYAYAIIDQDADALVRAMTDSGWYPPSGPKSDPQRILEFSTPGWAPIAFDQPFSFTPEWAADMVARQIGLAPGYQRLINEMSPPPHYLFLGRITIGLFSVLTGLRATGDWRAIFDEIQAAADSEIG